ncbi:MAG: ribosome small subunit-dependent GTPase A [Planctomycetales bacterium]|nr:ribosome small subunit-dependent GTPase A [Planctomycetales bacterium]
MAGKKKKIRTSFRKNRNVRTRQSDLTRDYQAGDESHLDADLTERISGKGALSRKRTVVAEEVEDDAGTMILPEIDESACACGRVLSVRGLISDVATDAGDVYRCATRRLLKTLATDQRHVVAAGDRVWFRPEGDDEGIIERVEPRRGVLSRTSRGRQHILVTNVDQLLIVASAAEPYLKPHLIDRYLVTAEKNRLRPIICINKVDLCETADLQPLIGVYAQLGYRVILSSTVTGQGIELIRDALREHETVISGQSGVGKSSLVNTVDPQLDLRVQRVSSETQKGKHTTTTARLIPLTEGGWVVDTPGIRQFQLWDVIPEEIAGFFRDLRPFVSRCRFADCTHTHETDCAVLDAVADGWIDERRYESYLQMFQGDDAGRPVREVEFDAEFDADLEP